MINAVNNENMRELKKTIHLRIILSAKYPKISIVTPVNSVNENVSIPKGAVSPPNPKYAEMINRFGLIILLTLLTSIIIITNRTIDKTGSLIELLLIL
jgi:hypothetical protein